MRTLLAIVVTATLAAPALAQWTRVAAVPADGVGAIYAYGGTLYVGAIDALYLSPDGARWTRSAPLPAHADGIWALAKHGTRLFAGTYRARVLESTDEGASWIYRDAGLETPWASDVGSFAIRDGLLYAGTIGAGAFRLDLAAGAPVWEPFGAGLPGNVDALLASDGLLVAGAGSNGYMYYRERGEAEWTERPYIAFDDNGPQVFAFTELPGVLLAGGSHGLFRSTDRGQTWSRFNPGVGLFQRVSFAADGSRIYALSTTTRGTTYVAFSDDAGVTWPLLDTLPGAIVSSAEVFNGALYAGRFDGLWVRPLAPTSAEDLPAESPIVLTSAPNPFASSTRLTYVLPAASEVTLGVYDLTGRHLTTLVEGRQPAGAHIAEWAPAGLSGGAYVVRLQAGRHAQRLLVSYAR